jgi:hypothetical protein
MQHLVTGFHWMFWSQVDPIYCLELVYMLSIWKFC